MTEKSVISTLCYLTFFAGFSEDYIISFGISKDSKNTSKRVLTMDQTSLGLSKEYLDKGRDEPEVKAYFK